MNLIQRHTEQHSTHHQVSIIIQELIQRFNEFRKLHNITLLLYKHTILTFVFEVVYTCIAHRQNSFYSVRPVIHFTYNDGMDQRP